MQQITVKRNNNSLISYFCCVIIGIQYYILYETKCLGLVFNIIPYSRNSTYQTLSLLDSVLTGQTLRFTPLTGATNVLSLLSYIYVCMYFFYCPAVGFMTGRIYHNLVQVSMILPTAQLGFSR